MKIEIASLLNKSNKDRILRLETERTVSEDWVVRYGNRFFRLEPQRQNNAPARSKVLVCEERYGGRYTDLQGARPRMPISFKKRKWAPPANHPWHQAVRREVQKRTSKLVATASRSAWPGPFRAKRRARPAKQRDAVGRARWESSFLELPGAELFRGKPPRREKEAEQKKGDIFNEVRKGTFLKSFDNRFRLISS